MQVTRALLHISTNKINRMDFIYSMNLMYWYIPKNENL